MRLRRILGALASIALSSGACFLPGFDVGGSGGSGSSTTSSTGGAGGAGGAPPQLCESEGLPPRPQGAGGGGGAGGAAEEPLRFALRNFDFGDGPPGEPPRTDLPGLDLDRSCTCCECLSAFDACTPPPFASATICDGDRGVDNAFARLVSLVGANATSAALNADVNEGAWTILVEVTGYNGLSEDDQVRLALYTTSGHKTNPDPAVLPTAPAWQGNDQWMRRADSVGTMGEPLVYTDQAYVTGGVLVGELEGFLSLGGSLGSRVNFRGGLMRVRLSTPSGQPTVLRDGMLGARWPLADIFATLSSIRVLGQPVCTDTIAYSTIKSTLCSAADVYSQGLGVNLCDAVSFGLAFTGEPVQFAPLLGASTATPGCAPELDPANDCCERVMPTDPCPR